MPSTRNLNFSDEEHLRFVIYRMKSKQISIAHRRGFAIHDSLDFQRSLRTGTISKTKETTKSLTRSLRIDKGLFKTFNNKRFISEEDYSSVMNKYSNHSRPGKDHHLNTVYSRSSVNNPEDAPNNMFLISYFITHNHNRLINKDSYKTIATTFSNSITHLLSDLLDHMDKTGGYIKPFVRLELYNPVGSFGIAATTSSVKDGIILIEDTLTAKLAKLGFEDAHVSVYEWSFSNSVIDPSIHSFSPLVSYIGSLEPIPEEYNYYTPSDQGLVDELIFDRLKIINREIPDFTTNQNIRLNNPRLFAAVDLEGNWCKHYGFQPGAILKLGELYSGTGSIIDRKTEYYCVDEEQFSLTE